ncbi:DNA cytosine methyltransferase [Azospirillum doebereinerae]
MLPFNVVCVDLFCGAGGLTYGLKQGGINVVAGVDLDASCEHPFTHNNGAAFIRKSVEDLVAEDLRPMFAGADFTMLAGCAPCQPFSTYTRGGERKAKDWALLRSFERLIGELLPDIVTMENVPGLHRHEVFASFYASLASWGYSVTCLPRAVCPEFGIPQHRKRLILLASRHGKVPEPSKTRGKAQYVSVKEVIGHLPAVAHGASDPDDPLHAASHLSKLNLKRIKVSTPGGTWRDWPKRLQASCHKKETGKTFPSVYGRMSWFEPSPTITTQCFGFGNGRFGHPEQDRGLTLREAAMLQTFPRGYSFIPESEKVRFKAIGRLIGNAVPPRLGEVIADTVAQHLGDIWGGAAPLTS